MSSLNARKRSKERERESTVDAVNGTDALNRYSTDFAAEEFPLKRWLQPSVPPARKMDRTKGLFFNARGKPGRRGATSG